VQLQDKTNEERHRIEYDIGSDEWCRDLLDNAYDMIQCVDPEGRFIYVNRAWRKKLGYEESEVDRLCIWDIIHPSHHESCKKHFATLMNRREALANVETIFVTKSKEELFVEGCVTVWRVHDVPRHTRGIFRNITAKKRVEQEREKLIADLRDSLARSHQLERLITVCAWTGKVFHRGRWLAVDTYLAEQFGVRISHGMSDQALKETLKELESLNTSMCGQVST
jgi:PAS domain S-box-containing protein